MKLRKKILLTLIALILAAVIGWLVYYLVHFYFYDKYEKYLSSYEDELGTEFKAATDSDPKVDGMVLVTENENLKLYTNPETAYIAVYDKRNGTTTYSNPIDPEGDTIASSTNIDYLKSQMLVDYFNASKTEGTFDTYSMAVSRGQISCESIENGIRYIYELGDKTSTTGIVPMYISNEKLDELMAKLPADEAKYVNNKYRDSPDLGEGFQELTEAAAEGKKTLRDLNTYFEEAGFTVDDYGEAMLESGVLDAVPITFQISLEYRLDEDGLDVSVPMDQVVEGGGGKIFRIQLLNYFGAAGVDESGYMVVPNGSGSIINFNNNKQAADNYSQYIYGIDPMAADYTVIENTEKARLSLFGICRESNSVLVTIEDGASLAYITAGVSGKINSYNYAYPTFVLRGYDKLSMFGTTGNEADIPIVEKNFYNVNLKVKYTFLTDENKGYAGLANYYRQRLISEGKLTVKADTTGDIPLYYDIIGGVKQTGYFLGTQYLKIFPMTTFKEAGIISDQLKEAGVNSQVMNYQGWFNGGFYHDVADKIKVIGKLGGKSGLEELSAKLTENNGNFYADVAFQKVSFISKRYRYSFETSRYYGAGYVAFFGQVNPTTLRQTSSLNYMETMYDLVSPKYLTRYVDKFASKITSYDINGISLTDLGDDVHSDKKRTNVINREEALDVVTAQLDILKNTQKKLMVNGGNDYAFPYVTDILNAPTSDNEYFIVDEEIPLYEMILHGCIGYSGDLINLSDSYDVTDVELRLIEYGASPHFVFTWENSTEMKYTGLSRYYSTTFTTWKDDAVGIYKVVNEALKQVSGATMVNHEILQSGVKKITYSNGVVFYINTTQADVTEDDILIPARSYEVEGE